jgi:uncharacterized protein (DUF302 family)
MLGEPARRLTMPCSMCVAAMVRARIHSSDLGPSVAWVPETIAAAPPRSRRFTSFVASVELPGPVGRVGHRDAIEETWGRSAARRWMKRSPRASHAFLNENQTTTCSRSRAQLRLTSKGSLMPDSTQSSDGVITKPSSKSVAQTIDGLRRLIEDRGFTVFNVIDHSGVAERAGVQMPDSKLVMFGKPAVGATVMLAAPLAALDIPLKALVWQDRNGAVSVSYNSPGFLAERHHLEGALRAPFDAVESIVEALVGA